MVSSYKVCRNIWEYCRETSYETRLNIMHRLRTPQNGKAGGTCSQSVVVIRRTPAVAFQNCSRNRATGHCVASAPTRIQYCQPQIAGIENLSTGTQCGGKKRGSSSPRPQRASRHSAIYVLSELRSRREGQTCRYTTRSTRTPPDRGSSLPIPLRDSACRLG